MGAGTGLNLSVEWSETVPRTQSTGTCQLCGGTFSKGSMATHLKRCFQKKRPAPAARPDAVIHLIIEARYVPQYWMHVVAHPDAELAHLDDLLRRVWCECCDHLSSFRAKEQRPNQRSGVDIFDAFSKALQEGRDPLDLFGDSPGELEMDSPLREVLLPPKRELEYTYDFGDSTELKVRSHTMYGSPKVKVPVEVLARNACGKPATDVCTDCMGRRGILLRIVPAQARVRGRGGPARRQFAEDGGVRIHRLIAGRPSGCRDGASVC